eukprot:jgi/Mesvir1/8713/Mv02645-RA.1
MGKVVDAMAFRGGRTFYFDSDDSPAPRGSSRRSNSQFYGNLENGLSAMQNLLRWPLLICIFITIAVELAIYWMLRTLVRFGEYVGTCLYGSRKLLTALQNSKTYDEWYSTALKLDAFCHLVPWKRVERSASPFYDARAVQDLLFRLDSCRVRAGMLLEASASSPTKSDSQHPRSDYAESGGGSCHNGEGASGDWADRDNKDGGHLDSSPANHGILPLRPHGYARDLMSILSAVYNANLAGLGMDNEALYSQTYAGTKHLIERFVDTVLECTKLVRDAPEQEAEKRAKVAFFTAASRAYGRTALCLSSGACMAYFHFGVARALLDQGLLPTIISGSSGGALVAAIVCTRTDEELREFLTPDLHRYLTACEEGPLAWFRRWLSTGQMFDTHNFMLKCREVTFQDMTFEEAYRKTGRILCISASNKSKGRAPILLNHVTTPNVVIWSAVLASSALPPLLKPITLMQKVERRSKRAGGGSEVVLEPFLHFGQCWSDGALASDIPAKPLSELLNVNHLIVSQTNPHIAPFFYESRGSSGQPTTRRFGGLRGGFISAALESLLKLEMKKWLRLVGELDLMPSLFQQDWSQVFLQKMYGNVTIVPRLRLADYFRLLSDPDREAMARILWRGQLHTWPKVAMIRNHLVLEQMLDTCLRDLTGQQVP